MLIRDLESKTGLDRATIRFYEKEGLVIPQKKENGYREYTEENLSDLLKIKLLRQLGMSLATIKGVQQGSENFSKVLSDQIQSLEGTIEATIRAKDVCTQLHHANTNYESLDAAYYLQLLDAKPTKMNPRSFREQVPRPYHPVRRFLARMLDYAILRILLMLLFVVILRIRPFHEFLSNLFTFLTPLLMVPVAAFFISKWGTTPGKWLFGLSVWSENGGKLTYHEARNREWSALLHGYGVGIPGYSIYRLYKSYQEYQTFDMDWDRFNEYRYEDRKGRRWGIVALVIAVTVLLDGFIISESMLPRFRGDLTISEFVNNYNFYDKILQDDSGRKLQADGTWYEDGNHVIVMDLTGTTENINQNFEFITDGSYIKAIRYENTWEDVIMFSLFPAKCDTAALTAVMSQNGMTLLDMLRFSKSLDAADMYNDGELVYQNVKIRWDIETENCEVINDYLFTKLDNKKSSVRIVFEIEIQ